MRFKIDYVLDGREHCIVIEGESQEEITEKAFIYLDEIGVDDASIEEVFTYEQDIL